MNFVFLFLEIIFSDELSGSAEGALNSFLSAFLTDLLCCHFILQECFSAPWMEVAVHSKTQTAVSSTICVLMEPLYVSLALKEQSLNLLHTTHVIHPRNPTAMYEPSQQTKTESFCKVAIRSAVECPHFICKIYDILTCFHV